MDAALLALAIGGAAALLRHPRAPWLVAIWGASSIVLGLLHPVRTQDPVARAPDQRLVLLALFVIPLLTPPLGAFGERAGLWPLPGGETLRWAGVALTAGGLAIRIAAMVQLGSRFSPRITIQREHPLETRGLYARVRHPGYLGAWLATFGAALAFGSALGLIGAALMALALGSRMRREEALLERHFGAAYLRYRARTRAVLPRLGPSKPD